MHEISPKQLKLTPSQRGKLFKLINRSSESIEIRVVNGKIIATLSEVECKTCLLRGGMEGIHFASDGRCNFCHKFDEDINKVGELLESIKLKLDKNQSNYSVLAFSGGKDSAMVLSFITDFIKTPTIAVHFNNGYIPQKVTESAKELCKVFGVSWEEKSSDISGAFRSYFTRRVNNYPCQYCIRSCFSYIGDICRKENCNIVFSGHWDSKIFRPLSSYTLKSKDEDITVISPLPLLNSIWKELMERIYKAGWKVTKLHGNTTNCELLPFIEIEYYRRYGYNPSVLELSNKTRARIITKKEARKRLVLPNIDEETARKVAKKLNLSIELIR